MKYASVELELTEECVRDCAASGAVDDAVAYWLTVPQVARQLETLTLEDSARILYGYGAWAAGELRDLETNKGRILWIAAGDIRDGGDYPGAGLSTYYTVMEGHGYKSELEGLTP